MLKKTQQKKKKMSTTSTVFLKLNDRTDKLNLKFALNLCLPKPSTPSYYPKHTESLKTLKSPTATPTQPKIKKSVKQNSHYQSPVVTPIAYQLCTPLETQATFTKQKSRNDYKMLYQVGSGGFGRVWKVQQKKTGLILAMKQISKAKVILKKSVASVINEKSILEELSHPFIINMKSYFQDRQFLYMTMEYLRGGDLRYHLCFYDSFSEEQTKFIAACIIASLEYTHSKGIIHRDLKPQNLVFEETGYLRVTDFGVARKRRENNSDETSGTPGYMAPEVICRMNHSFEADYFALGVIIYEMMMGTRPYLGQTRKEIRDKILGHQAKITERELPKGWSIESMNFVNKLLKRNNESRLGYGGIHQLKKHQWLNSINWRKLARKQLPPPFLPGVVTESQDYQREMQSTSQTLPNEQSEMLLRTTEIQNLFQQYTQPRKRGLQRY